MPLGDTFPDVRTVQTLPTRADALAGLGTDAAREAFFSAIGGIVFQPPVFHDFPGAVEKEMADGIWTWIARDIASGEAARLDDAIRSGTEPDAALDLLLPEILEVLKQNAGAEQDDPERQRRNTIQMGGEAARALLPRIIMALRRRPLLVQAANFGAAIGRLQDEAALASALQTITITNPVTRALWMQVMVGPMSNPSRAMAAAVAIAGGGGEVRITNAGYGSLVDALLSHAQAQIGMLSSQPSLFSDIDFACKAVNRFHRLMRAISYNLDIDRRSLWGKIIADLTGKMSERLERPLREITANVANALRRPRGGIDQVDPGDVLAALNGLYLLITVRQARDSLAVNAVLDQAWSDTGQAMEVLITRALDMYRANPGDMVARERLEAGIKMSEIRFNPEYADILRRARDNAERRTAQS